jgi:hypothetical protein
MAGVIGSSIPAIRVKGTRETLGQGDAGTRDAFGGLLPHGVFTVDGRANGTIR